MIETYIYLKKVCSFLIDNGHYFPFSKRNRKIMALENRIIDFLKITEKQKEELLIYLFRDFNKKTKYG